VSALPPPAQARALIVGLEKYEQLENADLPGAVDDALRMADLLERFGVPPERIELWLAPTGAAEPTTRKWQRFTGAGFEQRLTSGLSKDAEGGLLFLYWSGHGVVAYAEHAQYLLFPEAEKNQLRSFKFDNISNLLVDSLHAQFSHQVLVIDACRSPLTQWGVSGLAEKPMQVAPVDPFRVVAQCQLFASSLGQAGAQLSDKGSSLMQAIVADWQSVPAGQWPDFEPSFRRIQKGVETATNGQQIPTTASFARDWGRNVMAESASLTEPSLYSLLKDIHWPPDEGYRVHAIRSLRSNSPRGQMTDLRATIQHLNDLPETGDVPPLGEFVTRVVQALGDKTPAGLRGWLKNNTSKLQRDAIEARIGEPRTAHVLQLWHDDAPPSLQAALFDAENRLVESWDVKINRMVGRSLAEAIGETLHEAKGFVGDEVTLELCLPSPLLGHGLDMQEVPAGGESVRLGKDYAVILRCTDRMKSSTKRRIWLEVARKVLSRFGTSERLVRWAEKDATEASLLKGFFSDEGTRSIWIGISDAPPDHEQVLQICLTEGLPAVFWMSARLADDGERQDAEKRLEQLLCNVPQDLPRQLLAWRREQLGERTAGTALLLDDPRRLPPWQTQLGPSGLKKG